MSPIVKSDGVYATCCGDKILLRRQRFLQKFSRTNEAICRCYVSLACVASVSAWKDRGTGLSVFGEREMRNGTTANFRTETLAAQARWRRNVLLQLLPPRPGACEKALQEQNLSQDLSS